MEKFIAGMAIGAVAGALIVANSYKARTLVKKSQDEMSDKLDKMLDQKLKCFDKQSQEQTERTAD